MATPVPIVRCRQVGNPKTGFYWRFFCPHCSKHHTHPPGARHRAAQCQDRASTYLRTGYMLELAPPPAPAGGRGKEAAEIERA
jgi:hypothetical protein